MSHRNFKRGLIGCAFLLAAVAQAQIEKIGEIQYTSPEAAANGIPVNIEAQVTHLHPRRAGIFLFDGERGVYVHLPQPAELYENLRAGAVVRVKGVTSPGGFVPDIVAQAITVVDWRPLPDPRQFHFFEIYLPSMDLDCAWLTVWGRLVDVKVLQDFDYLLLELEVHGLRLSIQVPYSDEALAEVEALMFQRVMVPAVVGTVYNRHRQMTGRTFLVNSLDDFMVITEGDERVDLDVRPIETLMHSGANYQKALHTQGLVTYADENSVYLRGEETSLKVATLGGTTLRPGDYVDMLGFIWPQPISPAFRALEVVVLERRFPPEPLGVVLEQKLDSDWNYELIQTEATLVDIGETFGLSRFSNLASEKPVEGGRLSLLCRSGERIFEARLPSDMVLADELKPGARLQLTGICNLVPNLDPRWSHFTEGVWLELRLNDGVMILRPAPWWTTRRLLGGIVVVLAIAGLFMVWVILLRKTVARQTTVIGKQIERASVQSERQRVARELHDTLEQSLAGTAFQLQNSLRLVDGDLEKGKASLKLAQSMLRHCREESRGSIVELRGGLLEKMDLPSALDEAIQPLATECGAELQIMVNGQPRRLKPFAERHLLRIAKEAASNAARHASPKHIEVELSYEPTALSLTVSDDGAGFIVDQLTKSERFGLQGMRERANHISGMIEIESVVGRGTTIRVNVPSTKEWELT